MTKNHRYVRTYVTVHGDRPSEDINASFGFSIDGDSIRPEFYEPELIRLIDALQTVKPGDTEVTITLKYDLRWGVTGTGTAKDSD